MLLPKRVKYRRVHRGRMAQLDHQQPDRGRPYRHDPLHQAWR